MIKRSQERIDQTGEFFTPSQLVNEILDQLPVEVWSDPQKTWLEPTCGDGNFLVAILERLMVGLKEVIPDPDERHSHIIENQLFAVELMSDNAEACVERLNATYLNHNIVCADGFVYDYQFGRPELDDSGLFEQPAQIISKLPGLNAWYGKGCHLCDVKTAVIEIHGNSG